MARPRRHTPGPKTRHKAPRLYALRLPINRLGYDSRGRYWGTGLPVYEVEHDDNGAVFATRAKTAKEARDKVWAAQGRGHRHPYYPGQAWPEDRS